MDFHFEPSGKLKILSDAELAQHDSDSSVIVYDEGTLEDGSPYWLYIAVKPSKYREFKHKASRHEMIIYEEYGKILRFGREKFVPDAIKEEMKREYGCDENFISVLREDFIKAQGEFVKEQENKRLGDIVTMLKKKQPGS